MLESVDDGLAEENGDASAEHEEESSSDREEIGLIPNFAFWEKYIF